MAVTKAQVEVTHSVGTRVLGTCQYKREKCKTSGFVEKGRISSRAGRSQKSNGGAGAE